MSITETSSLGDVAFEVCTALDAAGVVAVLTGGSAAVFYAPDACQSFDLDFVLQFQPKTSSGQQVLASLGYRLESGSYVHDRSKLFLDFPMGPLAIGGEIVATWHTERRGGQILHVLSPTDCCRDRLSSFLHWNDRSGLAQALAVARSVGQRVDFDRIQAWCRREGELAKYAEFARGLSRNELNADSPPDLPSPG